MDGFQAYIDKSKGEVMFKQAGSVIGKSIQNDLFKSGFTYL